MMYRVCERCGCGLDCGEKCDCETQSEHETYTSREREEKRRETNSLRLDRRPEQARSASLLKRKTISPEFWRSKNDVSNVSSLL